MKKCDSEKTLELVSIFLSDYHARTENNLSTLLYLADRESLKEYGYPITNLKYVWVSTSFLCNPPLKEPLLEVYSGYYDQNTNYRLKIPVKLKKLSPAEEKLSRTFAKNTAKRPVLS